MSAGAARERKTTAKGRRKELEASGGEDAAAIWDRVRRRLRAELGEDVFSSWFARVDLEGVSAGVVRLSVPDGIPEGLDQVALRRAAAGALAPGGRNASAASTWCAGPRSASSPRSRRRRVLRGRRLPAPAGEPVQRPLRRLAARSAADLRELLRGPLERRRLSRRARRGGRAGGKRAGLQPALHPCRRRARQDASPAGDRATRRARSIRAGARST